MNTYQVRINDSDEEMALAMDIPNYSHLTPAKHEQRFAVFSANNHRQATAAVMTALGKMYRKGTHVPFLKT